MIHSAASTQNFRLIVNVLAKNLSMPSDPDINHDRDNLFLDPEKAQNPPSISTDNSQLPYQPIRQAKQEFNPTLLWNPALMISRLCDRANKLLIWQRVKRIPSWYSVTFSAQKVRMHIDHVRPPMHHVHRISDYMMDRPSCVPVIAWPRPSQ